MFRFLQSCDLGSFFFGGRGARWGISPWREKKQLCHSLLFLFQLEGRRSPTPQQGNATSVRGPRRSVCGLSFLPALLPVSLFGCEGRLVRMS